ncbi:hypothetical protein ACCS37_32280 [Rhizobium ruizarguesonis]
MRTIFAAVILLVQLVTAANAHGHLLIVFDVPPSIGGEDIAIRVVTSPTARVTPINLSNGLNYDAASRRISGKLTEGSYSLKVRADDPQSGQRATGVLDLRIVTR